MNYTPFITYTGRPLFTVADSLLSSLPQRKLPRDESARVLSAVE